LGVRAHTWSPSTQEAEAGGSEIQGQPGLHSKFKANLNYLVRSWLKTNNNKNQPTNNKNKGWRYSSEVEHLPSICKALGSISSTEKDKERDRETNETAEMLPR
jgi:hypothetical protein